MSHNYYKGALKISKNWTPHKNFSKVNETLYSDLKILSNNGTGRHGFNFINILTIKFYDGLL